MTIIHKELEKKKLIAFLMKNRIDKFNFKVFNKIYLVGDLHGFWNIIVNHASNNNTYDSCYIQVGDFQIGFSDKDEENLILLNNFLADNNNFLYVIRGNHDNPFWFNGNQFDEIKNKLDNILFIPDYTVLNINHENILFIGGAISIDRIPRIARSTGWWAEEVVDFDFDKASEFNNIDRMVCHTAPDFVPPLKISSGSIVYDYAHNDKLLLDHLKLERENMTKLVNLILLKNKIKSFFYGHFHNSYKFYHNNCEYIGLDINQFFSL